MIDHDEFLNGVTLVQGIAPTIAGRVELVFQLLGGQPVYDECGCDTGERTPKLISDAQAMRVLNGGEL